jgi:hypothetical protein
LPYRASADEAEELLHPQRQTCRVCFKGKDETVAANYGPERLFGD